MNETTREEHLQWCKDRAMEYVERGDMEQAVASMCSDLNQHEETAGNTAALMGVQMLASGLGSKGSITRWVQGFN